ncbi:MAG: prolyl oligopeptidase family serine peptidase [Ignavibacteriales bacterium]|nr:prolyl oligopeptidase family serine peptidase [Ignavibacteriales bacterium]
MKKLSLFIILILAFVKCSSRQPEIVVIKSEHIAIPDSILVITPENYKPENEYPLVILLHGWSGNFEQWNSITNLQEYSDAYNFIIACPDGLYDSWYINNTMKNNVMYEDFFWNDFIPYLQNNYSLDKNNIFITGLSMGGHGAITLFFKNNKFFKSAGSTSGILDLTAFPENWKIKNAIGNYDEHQKDWEINSAIYLLDSLKNFNKKIIIDCGTEDFAYQVNLNFAKKCYDLGINIKFYSIPGEHNRKHWKKMISKHFEFFANQL